MTKCKQQGFTLVEIAVVLVIIGLLLGAILQGQQLIASARVSNLSDQQAGIQAAYFGFIDRYRAVPGDMPQEDADEAIRESINTGGNGDGVLSAPPDWDELNAVWEHLAKSGFIRGSYEGSGNEPNGDTAPTNVFNGVVLLARHDGYTVPAGQTASPRLLYHFGQNISAEIARELDVKLDDGSPNTGSVRHSSESGSGPHESRSEAEGDPCIVAGENTWNVSLNPDSCNPVFIY